MAFAVRLDLDDFLAPAVDCVLPEAITTQDAKDQKAQLAANDLDGFADTGVKPDLIKQGQGTEGKAATVGLSDCLTCTGCLTSAETILLEQHSIEEFRRRAQTDAVVVSISPYVRRSLAQSWGVSDAEAQERLCTRLKALGVALVLDTQLADALSLEEA